MNQLATNAPAVRPTINISARRASWTRPGPSPERQGQQWPTPRSPTSSMAPARLFNWMKRYLRESIKALSKSASLIWINTQASEALPSCRLWPPYLPSYVEHTDVGPDVRLFLLSQPGRYKRKGGMAACPNRGVPGVLE